MAARSEPSTPFWTSPGTRTFLVIWFGQLISTIGSSLTGFGLSVYIYHETGSKMLFALINVVYLLPQIIVAPFTGVLVDRIDRRRAMIISDTGAAVSTGAIVVLLIAGRLEMWHILAAVLANSVCNTIQWPAWSAAQSLLVPKEHLGRSSGMVQIGDAVSSLFAPAMAGALFVTIGLSNIMVIDLLTFAFAVACLLVVRIPQPAPTAEEAAKPHASILSDASFGLRYIWARKPMLGLLLFFATVNFLLAGHGPLLAPLLLDATTPQGYGFAQSIIGGGMLAG